MPRSSRTAQPPALQVTCYTRFRYPRFRISTVLFQISYPRPNFKAYYLRLTFSRLIRECDANNKRSIDEFWSQFNTKMAIVIRFPFYAFSLHAVIRWIATPVYDERHSYYRSLISLFSPVSWGEARIKDRRYYSVCRVWSGGTRSLDPMGRSL
jgi:hypothetical protein